MSKKEPATENTDEKQSQVRAGNKLLDLLQSHKKQAKQGSRIQAIIKGN